MSRKRTSYIFSLSRMRQLLQFLRPFKRLFIGVLALTILLSFLAPLRPYLIQYTIDNYVVHGHAQGILTMFLWMVALLLSQCVLQYAHLYGSGLLGQKVIHSLRTRLYAHVQRLRLDFYNKTPVGKLVTRCVSDIETLSNVFSEGLASILSDLLQLFTVLLLMLYLDWRLTLVTLSVLPVLFVCTYIFKEKIKVAFTHVRNAVSALNTFVQEHVTGMHIVQVFDAQKHAFRKFDAINTKHRKANMRAVLYYSVYFPISQILQAISIGFLVWYGSGEVVREHLTLGLLISFILYIQMFFRPMHLIADRFNTLQLGMVSTDRIAALLASKEYIVSGGTFSGGRSQAELSFEGVWFSYDAEERGARPNRLLRY